MNFERTHGSTFSKGKAVSDCGRYSITWDICIHGKYFNAWFGESPRKHLTGTCDKDLATTVCEQHQRKFQQQRQVAA